MPDMPDMQANKRMTGFFINAFARAHASAAAWFAQTIVGDEAILINLTTAMIVSIAKINGQKWSRSKALSFLGLFIGKYIVARSATFLVKWLPGLGNVVNSGVSYSTTEVLGWATYLFVTRGIPDTSCLSDENIDNLWKEAHQLKNEDNMGRDYSSMNAHDKNKFDKIMKQLRDKNLADNELEHKLNQLEKIAGKYLK